MALCSVHYRHHIDNKYPCPKGEKNGHFLTSLPVNGKSISVITFPPTCREYGELLVRCGLIGEAVKVFEDLELWDNLIYCYWYVYT